MVPRPRRSNLLTTAQISELNSILDANLFGHKSWCPTQTVWAIAAIESDELCCAESCYMVCAMVFSTSIPSKWQAPQRSTVCNFCELHATLRCRPPRCSAQACVTKLKIWHLFPCRYLKLKIVWSLPSLSTLRERYIRVRSVETVFWNSAFLNPQFWEMQNNSKCSKSRICKTLNFDGYGGFFGASNAPQ